MYNPPPADLNSRELLVFDAPAGTVCYRSHLLTYRPIHFGTQATYRWDAPGGEFGVLYLAMDEHVAFMESIGRDALRYHFVPKRDLTTRGLSKVTLRRRFRLVDLFHSGGLARVGTEASLTSGAGYKNAQRWSKALRAHPEKPDGILYGARHDPTREALAIFQCPETDFEIGPCLSWANQPAVLGPILDHYGFGTDLE